MQRILSILKAFWRLARKSVSRPWDDLTLRRRVQGALLVALVTTWQFVETRLDKADLWASTPGRAEAALARNADWNLAWQLVITWTAFFLLCLLLRTEHTLKGARVVNVASPSRSTDSQRLAWAKVGLYAVGCIWLVLLLLTYFGTSALRPANWASSNAPYFFLGLIVFRIGTTTLSCLGMLPIPPPSPATPDGDLQALAEQEA
jgi:hypothetical protein